MSAKLTEQLPNAIREMGINATLTQKFQHGSYFVLEMHVISADKHQLLTSAKGPEFAEKFATLLDCLNYLGVEHALETIDAKILDKVNEALKAKLSTVLPQKLAEQGMVIECTVVGKDEQADFFYSQINGL